MDTRDNFRIPLGRIPEFASGSNRGGRGVESAYQRLGGRPCPTGADLTDHFPWMKNCSLTVAVGQQLYATRGAAFPAGFPNQSGRRVHIHEIRIYDHDRTQCDTTQTDLLIKMGDGRRNYVDEWLPWHSLQTEMDRFVIGFCDNFAMTLPAHFYLGRGHAFMMDIQCDANLQAVNNAEIAMWISLHGYGHHDREPIDLIRPAMGMSNRAVGDVVTISFNEARDLPLRDCWITRLGFAAGSSGGPPVLTNNTRLLQDVYLRPRPPEGYKWHDDEWFRIANICDQLGIVNFWTDPALPGPVADQHVWNGCVIHRPKVPYILEPGDSWWMQLWNNGRVAINKPFVLDVTLLGVQEKG